jgi:hypothetical protein
MSQRKAYLAYEFTGVVPLTAAFHKHGIEFGILDDPVTEELFQAETELLNREQDTVRTGHCARDGKTLFFAEFGMKITESARSFITFIYDRPPALAELLEAVRDIEPLTIQRLKRIQGESGQPPVEH